MQLGILGPFQLVTSDGELRTASARERTLLALLALHADTVLSTERLIDDLWGEQLPTNPGNALQQRIFHARRTLADDADLLRREAGGYRLAIAPEQVDVGRFAAARAAGQRAVHDGALTHGLELLEQALGLWRGEPLQGITAPWVDVALRRLSEERLATEEELIDALLAAGRHLDAIPRLEELTARHPLRERARGQLMRALTRAGRQAEALEVYDRTRALLAEELGLDPSPALRAVHADVLAQRDDPPRAGSPNAATQATAAPTAQVTAAPTAQVTAATATAATSAEGPPTGSAADGAPAESTRTAPLADAAPARPLAALPTPASRLIGRDTEVARLTALVAADRVVTVVGPGGVGKTRVALAAAAASQLDELPVVLVELGAVVDPAAVPSAVAGALGLVGSSGATPQTLLLTALQHRRTLLLLDSCEHLVEAVSDLVETLTVGCPQLRVVATSREPLGVDGEIVWPLDPLAVPDVDLADADVADADPSAVDPPAADPSAADPSGAAALDPGALAAARRSPAVELLLERVRSAAPDLELTDAELTAAVRIVRQLDGLPLAIELAAARARAMSLAEIAERLTDRLTLLSGGRRSSPARHRALTATLEWSWDLLDDDGRAAWMAASVPAAPFTTELLGALLPEVAPVDPVDAVTGLRDRSLLRLEHRGDPSTYAMLTTIRTFGQQQLSASGWEAGVRDAHADAVEGAVAAADRTTPTSWAIDLAEQRRWLPDVRAALRWRLASGDRAGAQRLAARLGWLALLTALTTEGRRLLDLTIGPLDAIAPVTRGPAAAMDPDGTTDPATSGPAASDPAATIDPDAALWAGALRLGDASPDGMALVQLAADTATDPVTASLARGYVATYRAMAGDVVGALEQIRAEPPQPGWLEGMWRLLEGRMLMFLGDLDAADTVVRAGVDRLDAAGAWSGLFAGDVLVHLAQLRGDSTALREAAARGLASCRQLETSELELELRCLLAMAEAADGELARAEVELSQAQELLERTGPAMTEALLAVATGYVRWNQDRAEEARTAWEAAARLHHWTDLAYGSAFAHWGLGHLAITAGDLHQAVQLLRRSLQEAIGHGDLAAIATALEGLAAAAESGGEHARAAGLLGAAAVRRAAMGAPAPLLSRGAAERTRTALRDHLGEEELAAAESAGAQAELDELLPDQGG